MARRPKKRVKYQHDASSGAAESSNFGEDPILQVQGLPSMPLDILEEILAYLQPLDILRLAQTSKVFRTFLMARSALRYWKAARRNVRGLPDCPEDLSEPEYANLAFSNRCNNCLKPCQKVLWSIRRRLCAKCTKDYESEMYSFDRHCKYFEGWPLELSMYDVLTTSSVQGFEDLCIIKDKKCRVKLEPSHFSAFKKRFNALSEEAQAQFVKLYNDRKSRIEEHAQLCEVWHASSKAARSDHLYASRKSRLESIKRRLKDMGWRDELKQMSEERSARFRKLPEVNKTTALTDRIWQRIEPTMVAYMEESKTERLARLKRACLPKRFVLLKQAVLTMHNAGETFPFPLDFALGMPEVRQIIDVPHDVEVTVKDFIDLAPLVPEYVAKWEREGAAHLSNLVRKDVPLSYDVDVLSLAVAVAFKCSCIAVRAYPEALAHKCRDSFYYPRVEGDQYSTVAVTTLQEFTPSWTRMGTATKSIKKVIEACGEDPSRVTACQMDKLDARLTCRTCSTAGVESIMTWRAAVEHKIAGWPSHYDEAKWERVPDAYCAAVKDLEINSMRLAQKKYESAQYWFCAHCPNSESSNARNNAKSKSAIEEHLLSSHGISEHSEKDIIREADSRGIEHRPVYLIFPEGKDDPLAEELLAQGEARFYQHE